MRTGGSVEPVRSLLLAAVGLLVLGTTLASPAASHERAHPPRGTPVLTISQQSLDVGRVGRGIVGGNLRWLGDADGAYDPATGRIRTDLARLMHRIGLGTIRYAGGTVANLFDYRHATSRPGCQTSGGFAAPQFAAIPAARSGYTIPRQADFARAAHSATNVMVPMVNTTPADAQAFVRAVARDTGQSSVVVELGNEPYAADQRYWRTPDLSRRLDDYILGGTREQTGSAGDDGLYPVGGCDLLHPATANGRAGQTYRPRYLPISLGTPPVVWVGGTKWHYVAALGDAGPRARAFTVDPSLRRIEFGDGRHGAEPRGALRIRYSAGPMPGFAEMYDALKAMPGVDVQVCSSWATTTFVARMAALGLPYDCIAVHQYAAVAGSSSTRKVYRQYVTAAARTNDALGSLRTAMEASAPDRFLAVTEFGGFTADGHSRAEDFLMDLVQAVEYAGQLRNGVRVSNLSNFDVLHERYGDRFALSGTGYLADMVHAFVGLDPVAVTDPSAGLTVAAARSGARGAVLVVNTRWQGAVTTDLQASGRGGTSCGTFRTLDADPGRPTRAASPGALPRSVRPTTHRTWRSGRLRHRFPARSITLLTFRPEPARGC
ncbi:hypothetical protein [Nocardioides panacisoli]|uniref:Alpha-L-arabinofuranosidase C-terminal domain-containing protein n=1 Tax=Nocardioides panacisoli TaxID=627624 RepID=A0ABP7IFR4_9ACTN